MELSIMEKLYNILLQLSLDEQLRPFNGGVDAIAKDPLEKWFNSSGLKQKFKDLCHLSDYLFNELNSRFEQLFHALQDVSEDGFCGNSKLHSHLWTIIEELVGVLRCCLVILTLLDSDFRLEKCRCVHQILKAFISFDVSERNGKIHIKFEKFVSGECTCTAGTVALELSDPCRPFLCTVLEVFADELLKHPLLRTYLLIVDSASSISEKLFMYHFNSGDIASVLEVISAHFILSVSDEQASENFIGRLVLDCSKDSRVPQLSLKPAILLLLSPIVPSAPKLFQAHLISLVSEAIGDGISSKNLVPDGNMDCYLAAFERSVILYSTHVSNLQMDGFCIESKCTDLHLLDRSFPNFESLTQKVTMSKLNHLLSRLHDSWESYLCLLSSKTKDNLLAEYITFIKERLYIFTDSCGDMVFSILDCILHRTFSEDAAGDLFCIKGDRSAEDIWLLVSILKLMSISLIQVIRFLSNSGGLGCLNTLENTSLHEEYDFLISIINCIQQFNICLPIQTFLSDVMRIHQTSHKDSKSMLMHFSGLLSISVTHGLDFLAKASISLIMALIRLFIFEEGDLVALRSLMALPVQPLSSEISSHKAGEGAACRRSSYKVASEFHRIQARHSCHVRGMQDEGEIEEGWNGKIFLDCLFKGYKHSSDEYADLVDFIECEKGKDYSSYLRNRDRHRKWKYAKMTSLRKMKREKWKYLMC